MLLLACRSEEGSSADASPVDAPSQLPPGQELIPLGREDAGNAGDAIQGHLPPFTPPSFPPRRPEPSGAARRAMYIVAHQDDDLGVMNPDLMNDLASGAAVQTVYLTSGDAGFTCNEYTSGRELGVRAAYAQLLGVPDLWDAQQREFGGKLVRVLTLRDTRVRLAFLGLHNSGLFDSVLPDLELLWNGAVETVETRPYDGRARIDRYTRAELIETLTQVIADFEATHVNTLDSSRLQPLVWPFDHSDHAHSALFAMAALQRYAPALVVGMYRTYNFQFEQENVSASAATTKLAAFQTYMKHDAKICTGSSTVICGQQTPCDAPTVYAGYEKRQYRVVVYQNVTGVLRGPQGKCLQADATTGRALLLPCNPLLPQQQWRVSTDRSIRQLGTGLCLTAAASSRGSALAVWPCSGAPEQRFLLTAQSQLRGPDATCVQSDGEQLTIQECTLDLRQMDWNPQLYPSVLTALIDGFTDTEIPNALSYYGTLSFADIDGDRAGDVCMRGVEGIYCAFSRASAFLGYSLKLPEFSDANGWFLAPYGSTIQFGDIDGDKRADVCGRGRTGVHCATWDPLLQAFVGYAKRTHDADFSDAKDYHEAASYYRSLRLADVNADGLADLCGRHAGGIECALAQAGGVFAAATQWVEDDFTDELGWKSDDTGSTLRYGDVDGDGLLDVCGRSPQGIRCAKNNGAGKFVNGHTWSFTGDFSDNRGWSSSLSYYGSIQLVDIDADGRADVCGRSPTGILCGLSTGSGFSFARPLSAATSFDDREGWSLDRYGSTLGFLDLDLDGLPDLCAWGPDPSGRVGLRCALSE